MQVEYILSAHGIGGGGNKPVPPIENFRGVSSADGTEIKLTWKNSDFNEFARTEIFMDDQDISNLDYDELSSTGNKIFSGTAPSYTVKGAKHGQPKFFKAFQIFSVYGEEKPSTGVSLQVVPKDTVAPGNITGMNIRSGDKAIFLSWKNPSDSDFEKVIIRVGTSSIGNINDGLPLYVGAGTSATYTVTKGNTTHYIRAFTEDTNGNINSSTGMMYTAETNSQQAPSRPSISNLKFDSVTVTGGSNTEVRLDGGTWYSSSKTFTGLAERTSYVAYARTKATDTHFASSQSTGTAFKTPRKVPIPGSDRLQAGTMQEGFYGFVPASEIINGKDLSSKCGITEGDLQNNDIRWMKFAWKGKILFRPQKPIRSSISWDHINSKGCVYGKNIDINGNTYKVRLMRGALTDPSRYDNKDKGAHGSEHNRLVLPLHENAKTGNWGKRPAYVESDLPDWGVGLTDSDFGMYYDAPGASMWCMETTNEDGSSAGKWKVIRGDDSEGVYYTMSNLSRFSYSGFGWVPVLEVVE